jgi:hypothetical protein
VGAQFKNYQHARDELRPRSEAGSGSAVAAGGRSSTLPPHTAVEAAKRAVTIVEG